MPWLWPFQVRYRRRYVLAQTRPIVAKPIVTNLVAETGLSAGHFAAFPVGRVAGLTSALPAAAARFLPVGDMVSVKMNVFGWQSCRSRGVTQVPQRKVPIQRRWKISEESFQNAIIWPAVNWRYALPAGRQGWQLRISPQNPSPQIAGWWFQQGARRGGLCTAENGCDLQNICQGSRCIILFRLCQIGVASEKYLPREAFFRFGDATRRRLVKVL